MSYSAGVNLGGGGRLSQSQRLAVSTVANIVLNFFGATKAIFAASAAFGVNKTVTLTNVANALEFEFTFTLTAGVVLTLPANFVLTNPEWANPLLTILDAGKYNMHGHWDGTNWLVIISGVYT